MNAAQSSHRLASPKKRRLPAQPTSRRRRQDYWAMTAQVVTKILVNGVLTVTAIAALNKLISEHQTQQIKLEEIRTEVENTQQRVDLVRTQFNRSFDPLQAESLIQEQTTRANPNQRPIIWLEKTPGGNGQ